jgi:hypothetical protein
MARSSCFYFEELFRSGLAMVMVVFASHSWLAALFSHVLVVVLHPGVEPM